MKTSFIATVLNEERSIGDFLRSIFCQSKRIDEVIIVDGGSTDNTIAAISNFKFPVSNPEARIKLIFKKGNRSVGRNEAIKKATNEIILCSDAGCTLDKDWAKNISEPFNNPKVDVVAGYYKGNAKNVFQKCLVPYVLVMEDKINKNEFLPSGRSMAFRRNVWEKVGKFDEKLSICEDYAFANALKNKNVKITFQKQAITNWIPRKNMQESFVMFFKYALGDVQARIFRPKVILLLLRYSVALVLLLILFLTQSYLLFEIIFILAITYLFWAFIKNYRYVKEIKALYYLPLIQLVSDFAVILGTIRGILQVNIRKR